MAAPKTPPSTPPRMVRDLFRTCVFAAAADEEAAGARVVVEEAEGVEDAEEEVIGVGSSPKN